MEYEPTTEEGLPIVHFFWRPGCGFCRSLDRQLAQHDLTIHYHNIWENEAARETVRALAEGNETVPTIVIGDSGMVNPSASLVLRAIEEFSA